MGPQSNSEAAASKAPLHLELFWGLDSEPAEVAKIDGPVLKIPSRRGQAYSYAHLYLGGAL